MKLFKPVLAVALAAAALGGVNAWAAPGGHGGGGFHGGGFHGGGYHGGGFYGGGFRGGVVLGVGVGPWGWPGYWYGDPYYGYYYPPVVVTQDAPVYVQGSAAPDQSSWYYCDNPKGYYPYVKECPSGWRAVPAQQPSAPPAQ